MIRDGQQVGFVGEAHATLRIGDTGRVLSSSGDAAHVLWATGRKAGEITLEDTDDLAPTSRRTASVEVDDSLSDGSLVVFAARDVLDAEGEAGLLNRLNDEGHLAAFSTYAEQALEFVAGAIRRDPSFQAVLGQLEPEESASLVSLAACTLLRDAFSEAS